MILEGLMMYNKNIKNTEENHCNPIIHAVYSSCHWKFTYHYEEQISYTLVQYTSHPRRKTSYARLRYIDVFYAYIHLTHVLHTLYTHRVTALHVFYKKFNLF